MHAKKSEKNEIYIQFDERPCPYFSRPTSTVASSLIKIVKIIRVLLGNKLTESCQIFSAAVKGSKQGWKKVQVMVQV